MFVKSILISVIVPVYNAESYIERCINSLLKQSLKKIEIIAINDGSADNSLAILQSLAQTDIRLRVINQENQGVSMTRNKGIELARGEYIGFVDADDYIEPDMYEKLYREAIKHHCDVVVSNVYDETPAKKVISLNFKSGKFEIDHSRMDEELKEHIFKFGHAVWHKIYRRQLIVTEQIKFYSYSEVSSEDMLFNLLVLSRVNSIYYLNEPLYHYVNNEQSLTKRVEAKNNMIRRSKKTIKLFKEHYENSKLSTPLFIDYLTYTEFLRVLANGESDQAALTRSIRDYSEIPTFNTCMYRVALTSSLDEYFYMEKRRYPLVYRTFNTLLALLCLIKQYRFAAYLYSIRLKFVQRSIKKG